MSAQNSRFPTVRTSKGDPWDAPLTVLAFSPPALCNVSQLRVPSAGAPPPEAACKVGAVFFRFT
jgi:hypothetical protein